MVRLAGRDPTIIETKNPNNQTIPHEQALGDSEKEKQAETSSRNKPPAHGEAVIFHDQLRVRGERLLPKSQIFLL